MRRSGKALGVLVLVVLLAACGGRDLSTPSSRIVGHWRAEVDLVDLHVDAFFGALDEDGVVAVTFARDDGDMGGSGTYRVVSEEADGEILTARLTLGGQSEEVTVTVPRDGKAIRVRLPDAGALAAADRGLAWAVGGPMSLSLDYVDGKTAP